MTLAVFRNFRITVKPLEFDAFKKQGRFGFFKVSGYVLN